MLGSGFFSITSIAQSSMAAAAPSLGIAAAFTTLAVCSLGAAGVGTAHLLEGIRTADLSSFGSANKFFAVALGCICCVVLIANLSGVSVSQTVHFVFSSAAQSTGDL